MTEKIHFRASPEKLLHAFFCVGRVGGFSWRFLNIFFEASILNILFEAAFIGMYFLKRPF
jgi:hypothetical protein